MPPARRTRPKQLLTRLVLRKSKHLNKRRQHLFSLWRSCKRVEYLKGGMPYKVTRDPKIRAFGGTYINGLNKPLILVASGLTLAERGAVAMHELYEWSHSERGGFKNEQNWQAHMGAQKRDNPRLRKSIVKKTK